MLQVIAFLAMEAPTGMHCDAIRDEQVKVFRTIPPLDPKHLVRGQFKGYKNEKELHRVPAWKPLPPCAWKFSRGVGQACHS
jgi:glucose-6-phosphate 1-dehydrogenase